MHYDFIKISSFYML